MKRKCMVNLPETVDKEKSWRSWLGQGDLKVSTEALLCAAQVLYR